MVEGRGSWWVTWLPLRAACEIKDSRLEEIVELVARFEEGWDYKDSSPIAYCCTRRGGIIESVSEGGVLGDKGADR